MNIDTTKYYTEHDHQPTGYGLYAFTAWWGGESKGLWSSARSMDDAWRKVERSLDKEPDRVELVWFIRQ